MKNNDNEILFIICKRFCVDFSVFVDFNVFVNFSAFCGL